MNQAEQERKELNKKLIKSSFQEEMKNGNRKGNVISLIVDFLAVLIGLCITDYVEELLDIDSALIEILIGVVIIMIFLSIGSFISKRIIKR